MITFFHQSNVINAPSRDNYTVLHWAVSDTCGSVECVSKLLKHGANPNLKADYGYDNRCGHTPLHFAVQYNKGKERLSKLSLLLQAGADVNAKTDDKYGYTPLHYAALEISNHDCVDVLLAVSNINVNEIDKTGKTALDLAYEAKTRTKEAKEKEYEIIKNNTIAKLISAGSKRGSEMKINVFPDEQDNKQ